MNRTVPAIILTLAMSSELLAKTTLRIPLMSEDGRSMVTINKELKAHGLKEFPLYVEISTEDKEPRKKIEKIESDFRNVTKRLGNESELLSELYPNEEFPGTCYTGVGGDSVVGLVFSLSDAFYSDQLNLWGFKYGKERVIDSYASDNEDYQGETEEFLNRESKAWREWNPLSSAVLMLTAYSDSGDDVNESIIPMCR